MVMAVVLISNIVLELLVIRTTCKVLEMRSNLAFGVTIMALTLTGYAMMAADVPVPVRTAIISPLMCVVIPTAMSRGPLRTRLVRVGLIALGLVITELSGTLFCTTLLGIAFPQDAQSTAYADIALIYALTIPLTALIFELLILLCDHLDRQGDTAFELPIILLCFLSFVVFGIFIIRMHTAQMEGPAAPTVALLCSLLTLGFGFVTYLAAQQDALARHRLADRTAMLRQTRYMRQEIEASAHRAMGMRRFRHDLANQIDVVMELAEQGRTAEADRYLAMLQDFATVLTGSHHE